MSRTTTIRFADQKTPGKREPWHVKRAYGTILVLWLILVLGVVTFAREKARGLAAAGLGLEKREFNVLSDHNEECRFVHRAKDKCAFIKANCPDEEAGLFSYLQLYYCRLPNAKPVAFIILTLWLGMLFSTIGIAASDFLCINLSTIASILGMSESLAGVTFLAFGNGSPDVFSTFAAMSTHSGSLAVGELIGAASFITAVVAGSMALVRPFKVARKSFVRDVGFFVVAAAFSMVFLADGSLRLWECAVMVGFYVFYVVFVVSWHWYVGRRRKRREREVAARTQFQGSETQELDLEASSEEEDFTTGERGMSSIRGQSPEEFRPLEAPVIPVWKVQDEDVDDETRDRYLKELQGEMQLSRPYRARRNTIAPIRPSLAGALEFRSVLSSLEKQRNIQTTPINLRRYSDEAGPQFLSVPGLSEERYHDDSQGFGASDPHRSSASGRNRAVSANDAKGLKLDTSVLQNNAVPEIDLLGPDAEPGDTLEHQTAAGFNQVLHSPRFSLSPPTSEHSTRNSSPAPPLDRIPTHDHLAPPSTDFYNPVYHRSRHSDLSPAVSPSASPRLGPHVPRIDLPPARSRSPSPGSPLSIPRYIDDDIRSIRSIRSMSRSGSIHLPPPSLSPETSYGQNPPFDEYEEPKPLKWWPYQILPPPQILLSTLFPTLYNWREKSIWDKLLGLLAAPAVFFLTMTLPVVEPDKDDDDIPDIDPGILSPENAGRSRSSTMGPLPLDSPTLTNANGHQGATHDATKSPMLISSTDRTPNRTVSDPHPHPHPHKPSSEPPASSPKEWNRWLVSAQITTAPVFVAIIGWANVDDSLSPRNLLRPVLFALLASMVFLAVLLATTTPTQPPRYRPLLCFFGFIVAIAWISSIANEVVGVLKAFGVILGISDAILGLTIFAVGNSLGDLVADITVARLGYPVMALSACFGGPMLNILLGIGIGGLYMTVKDGTRKHQKHPNRPIVYKPYEIEVSTTLMISGITLLVTLLGLLVVVPLNGWRMDRKVGWGLVVLWCLSTVGNLVVEILGLGGDLS